MTLSRKAVRGLGAEIAELRAEAAGETVKSAWGTQATEAEIEALRELADAAGQRLGDLIRLAVRRLVRDAAAMTDEPKPMPASAPPPGGGLAGDGASRPPR